MFFVKIAKTEKSIIALKSSNQKTSNLKLNFLLEIISCAYFYVSLEYHMKTTTRLK